MSTMYHGRIGVGGQGENVSIVVVFPSSSMAVGGRRLGSDRKSVAPPRRFCASVCARNRCGGARGRPFVSAPLIAVYPPRGARARPQYPQPWPPPRNTCGRELYRRAFFGVTTWAVRASHHERMLNVGFISYWGGPGMYEIEHNLPRVVVGRVA